LGQERDQAKEMTRWIDTHLSRLEQSRKKKEEKKKRYPGTDLKRGQDPFTTLSLHSLRERECMWPSSSELSRVQYEYMKDGPKPKRIRGAEKKKKEKKKERDQCNLRGNFLGGFRSS
jgi:hypothetical protein